MTIQSPQTTVDATGARTETWADFATIWASVEPSRGREYFAASQIQSSTDTRIRIRYRADINEKMRVVHVADSVSGLTNVYGIDAVIPVAERRHEMELMCTKRGAEGFRG